MKNSVVRLLVVGLLVLVPTLLTGPAFAQQTDTQSNSDEEGESVIILKFDTLEVSQEVMDTFYRSMNRAVDDADGMHVTSGGEMTINDLILTIGCDSPNAKCLTNLEGFVDADRIVFGSVQRSADVYMFSMKMFDFSEGEFTHEMPEQTVEGDAEKVQTIIPALLEGFLHGDVGKAEIKVSGVDSAKVLFDGEEMGTAPTILKDLPLGQHAITVETASGEKKTEIVLLRKGRTARVNFSFEPQQPQNLAQGPDVPAADSGFSSVPGWIAAGVGLAGVGFGLYEQMQLSSHESSASSSVCGSTLCSGVSAQRASALQSDMDSAATMTVIGYSVGAIGLATGGYLLYRAYSGSEAAPPAANSTANNQPTVRVAPTTEGVSVGIDMSF